MATIDAATVEQELRGRNSKIIERSDVDYKSMGHIYIYNVGPHRWNIGRGGLGEFIIPPCPEGAEVSPPLKIMRMYPEGKHLDMNKMAEILQDGMKLAIDIVGYSPHRSKGADLRKFGVFIAVGDQPTKGELTEARERLHRHYLDMVQEANQAYMAGPRDAQDVISGEHRKAAVATNNGDLPWVTGAQKMSKCPVCKSQVDPEAAICVACKAVLDVAVVIANRVPGYEHLWNKPTQTQSK